MKNKQDVGVISRMTAIVSQQLDQAINKDWYEALEGKMERLNRLNDWQGNACAVGQELFEALSTEDFVAFSVALIEFDVHVRSCEVCNG